MKKINKFYLSSFVMLCVMVIFISFFEVKAAPSVSEVSSKLEQIKNQYVGKTSWPSTYGAQCYSFAHFTFNTVFNRSGTVGTYSSGTEYKFNNPASDVYIVGQLTAGYSNAQLEALLDQLLPGDYVQLKRRTGGPHSEIVYSVDATNNNITIIDANSGTVRNQVRLFTQNYFTSGSVRSFKDQNQAVTVYRKIGYSGSNTTVASGNNPTGTVDMISGGKRCVTVRGWAFDRDSLTTSLDIHVYVGGPAGSSDAEGHVIKANTSRPDVESVYSGVGQNHGFEQAISTNKVGTQSVYVYAINTGLGENILIGSGTVNIQDYNTPIGSLDSVKGGDETITIRGWAFDKDVPTSSIDVHVYVGGPAGDKNASGYVVHANQERTDVGSTYSGVGNYHGYNTTINVDKIGNQAVYVYAINSGGGTDNPCIGSSSVTINKKIIPVSSISVTRYGTVNGAGYCINTVAKLSLGVNVLPENATEKEVVWSSSDKTIAEVDQSGNVSGKKTGTVYITATSKDGKCSANALVKVVSGEIIYGDINYDGKITATDLAQMVMAINGSYTLSNAERKIFDLNGDEKVNETDKELLNEMILGDITIFPVEQLVSQIVIEKMPEKTKYFVGENISTSGLILKAYYRDGTSKEITNYNISGNTLTSGEKTITLSYTEKTVTKTVEYKINVIDNSLSKIEIISPPNKSEYVEGDCFDAEGITIKAYYLDGSSKMIDSFDYDKRDALTSTDNKIGLFYDESGVVCYTYQTIIVRSICEACGHTWEAYEYSDDNNHCRKCTVCGESESEKCSIKTITILPTCINEGYTERYCTVCGHSDVYNYVEQLNHTWDDGVVTDEATCTKEGELLLTCKECGETKTEKIAKKSHTEVIDEAVPATCTETGKSEGSHCSVCGEIIKEQEILPAKGHQHDEGTVTRGATCTKEGELLLTCTECGETKTEKIAKKPHTELIDEAVPATCTETGKSEGSHCSVCGKIIKEQEILPAKGHQYDEGTVTREVTCTKEGELLFTCTECGETKTEKIAKKPHAEVKDEAVPATCTETGKSEGCHCSVCGVILKRQQYVAARGHKYNKGVVTKIPTSTSTGVKTYTCSECGASYTEIIPVTNDNNELTERAVDESKSVTNNDKTTTEKAKDNDISSQDKDKKEAKDVGESLSTSTGDYKVTVTGDKPEAAFTVKPQIISGDLSRLFKAETPVIFCGQ